MNLSTTLAALAALAICSGAVLGLHSSQPGVQGTQASAPQRVGDPYPLDTCPVSGKKLSPTDEPSVKLYEGREVRFCCSGCAGRVSQKLPANCRALG